MNSKTTQDDAYTKLAILWTDALWGWADHVPGSGVFQKILKEHFDEEEIQVLSDIPLKPIPLECVSLDEISANSSFPREKIEQVLDGVVARKLLFAGKTKDGNKGYRLLNQAYGFSQVFYWQGKKDSHTREMARLEKNPDYLKAKIDMFTQTDTKAFRYIPVTESIDPNWQNVYPTETIEKVIASSSKIALAHCPCRIRYELDTGESCGHSTDVCMKVNELAECVIDAGLAKEINHDEALDIIRKANKEGLVHFADNTGEGIKHICNCCGCACWNVGPIRRRQVPRDLLMATYFLRETIETECTGCGNCEEICPVDAVSIEDGVAQVDLDWCIGCGVCIPRCDFEAIKLVEKKDLPIQTDDFSDLYSRIGAERTSRLKARNR